MDENKSPVVPNPKAALIDPSTLLKNSWDIFLKQWKGLLFLSLFPYLSLIPFLLIAGLFVLGGFFLYGAHNYTLLILLAAIGVILAVVYLSISFSIGSVAMLYRVTQREKILPVKEALRKGWQILWAYWYLSFLTSLLIFGGYLLFLIPGIIFSVWFAFALYILVVENKRGMDAIVTSREYVRGNWWGVLGRIVLLFILTLLIMYVPSILFTLLHEDRYGGIIQLLFQLAVTPFSMIYMVLLYESLRSIHTVQNQGKTNEKRMYILVAVLGVVAFLLMMFFVIRMSMTALNGIQKSNYKTPTNLKRSLPDGITSTFSQTFS